MVWIDQHEWRLVDLQLYQYIDRLEVMLKANPDPVPNAF